MSTAPTGRAMGSHQSHRAQTTTWLTPPHIIESLGHFDLDPCGHQIGRASCRERV